jgi:ClpP class serine protease
VDAASVMFDRDVARGRGVGAAKVREKFGQGLMFGAEESVSLGMADRVATLDATVSRFLTGGRVNGPRKRAEETPSVTADVERRRREVERLR